MIDQLTLIPCGPIAPQDAPAPPLASIPPGTTRGPDGWQQRVQQALEGVEVWVPRTGQWLPIGPMVAPHGARSLVTIGERLTAGITFDLGHHPIAWATSEDQEEGERDA
jgi:hypothetical protein